MLSSAKSCIRASAWPKNSSLLRPSRLHSITRSNTEFKPHGRQLTKKWAIQAQSMQSRLYTTPTIENAAKATAAPETFVKEVVVPDGGGLNDETLMQIIISGSKITNEAMIPVTPETIATHIWLMLQDDLGIPLWAAMALTTWGIRTAALPIFFAQVRNMATLSLLGPKIQQIKQKISHHDNSGDQVMVKFWEERLEKLYKVFDATPWKNFSSAIVVVPLMVAQAFSARYMLGHTPQMLQDSGPLWLSDLTLVDPTYVTPLLYVGLQLLILRLNVPMQSGIIGDVKNLSKTTWALLACYSAALGFLCSQFPAAISTLWLYSMSFTALSNAAMYLPWVRKRLGIATSLPLDRPSHLPPVEENKVKSIVDKELLRETPK